MPYFTFKTIRAKLTFWFIIAALIPLTVALVVTYEQRLSAIEHNTFEKLSAIRDLKVERLHDWVSARTRDVTVMSKKLENVHLEKLILKDSDHQQNFLVEIESIRESLKHNTLMRAEYSEIFIINPLTGKILVSTLVSSEGANKSTTTYFNSVMRSHKSYIKDIHYSKLIAENTMAFSAPIMHRHNESRYVVGVLVAFVDLESSLHKILLDKVGLGKTGETYIVNKDRIVLSQLRWHDNAPLNLKLSSLSVIDASHGKTGVLTTKDYRGEKVVSAYTYIPETDWGFISEQGVDELNLPVKEMLFNFLLLFVVLLALLILTGYFLGKSLTAPIIRLSKIAKQISEGDYSARNTTNVDNEIGSIGSLAESISYMSVAIEEKITAQSKTNDQLTYQAVELTKARLHAEDSSRAKSYFLANMSHEIRTPMNAIVGLIHLLQKDDLTLKQTDRLNKINAATDHLLGVINNILDISKIEAGQLTLEYTNFVLVDIFDHIQTMLKVQAKEKGLTFILDLDEAPIWVKGDQTRLHQALLNLAGNAIKFSKQGTIYLRAKTLQQYDNEIMVRFEVQDHGIGIEANKISGLFKMFEQLDASTSRKFGGTGLGLAITRHLAEMMGGEAGVKSEIGKGSTFWFTAKLTRGQEDKSALTLTTIEDVENELRTHCTGSRILLVEDNAINREVVLDMLSGLSLVIDAVENGQEAVNKVSAQDYDLILMDIQMPVMDGLEATRLIHLQEGKDNMPILAMTANVFAHDRDSCKKAGINDFVAKPIDPKKLYLTLIRWLPKRDLATSKTSFDVSATADTAYDTHLLKQLEQIDGLDVALGLRSLRGNVRKYFRLLRQFDDNHMYDMNRLKASLAQGKPDEAKFITHTLKGATGMLGLIRLQSPIQKLEKVLRSQGGEHNHNEINQLIDTIYLEQSAFHRVLSNVIEQKLPAQEVDPDPAKGQAILNHLNALLKMDDSKANNVFLESKALMTELYGTAAEELGQQIEAYNYQKALETIETIKTTFTTNLSADL